MHLMQCLGEDFKAFVYIDCLNALKSLAYMLDRVPYQSIQWPIGDGWGVQIFYSIRSQTKPLVLERIVKSLTIPPSQCSFNDLNLWPVSDTICRIVCLTDSSNDQLVKDEGAQIFYSIRSQTKPIGIEANCEIFHNIWVGKAYNQFKP